MPWRDQWQSTRHAAVVGVVNCVTVSRGRSTITMNSHVLYPSRILNHDRSVSFKPCRFGVWPDLAPASVVLSYLYLVFLAAGILMPSPSGSRNLKLFHCRHHIRSRPLFISSIIQNSNPYQKKKASLIMSRGGGTTLYVTGFGHGTRARDLAYEFERYAYSSPSSLSRRPYPPKPFIDGPDAHSCFSVSVLLPCRCISRPLF